MNLFEQKTRRGFIFSRREPFSMADKLEAEMFQLRWNMASTYVESDRREFIFEEIGLQIHRLDHSQEGFDRHTSIDLETQDLGIIKAESDELEEFMKAHPQLSLRMALSTKGNDTLHEASVAIGIEQREPRAGKGNFDQQPTQAVFMDVLANLRLKTGHTRFRKIDYANYPFPKFLQSIAETEISENLYAARGMVLLVVDASLKKLRNTT